MKDLERALESLGIKRVVPFTVTSISTDSFRAKRHWPSVAMRNEWLDPTYLDQRKVALSNAPWGYISAPSAGKVNVQRAIQDYMYARGDDTSTFLWLDIETTGTNIAAKAFGITEISMAYYRGLGYSDPASNISALVKPTDEQIGVWEQLINKAERGARLTTEERYAIYSLKRYADGFQIDPATGKITHSALFDATIAESARRFTTDDIAAMRQGIENLKKYGVTRDELLARIDAMLVAGSPSGRQARVVLGGHNIIEYDIPALRQLLGDDWAHMVKKFGGERYLDTYELMRIMDANPINFYNRMAYYQILQEMDLLDKPLTTTEIAEIAELARKRVADIDFQGHGLLTVDALRAYFGLSAEGAHVAGTDVLQSWDIARRILPTIDDYMTAGALKVDSQTPWSTPRQIKLSLQYLDRPLDSDFFADKYFYANQSYMGTGHDFTIDLLPGEATPQGWVINKGRPYKFEGFYKDTIDSQDIYIAKFTSVDAEKVAFITGTTEEELQKKLQRARLIPYSSADENFTDYLIRLQHEDYARREIARWSGFGSTEGYSRMRRFVDAVRSGDPLEYLTKPSELRDVATLKPRIESELPFLERFIEVADASGLSGEEKSIAFARFYRELENLDPTEKVRARQESELVARIKHPLTRELVDIPISDDDRFTSRIYGLLDETLRPNLPQYAKEAARASVFTSIINELVEEDLLDADIAQQILDLGKDTKRVSSYQVRLLRDALLPRAMADTAQLSYASVAPRDLSALSLDEATEMAKKAIDSVRRQKMLEIPDGVVWGLSSQQKKRLVEAVQEIKDAYAKYNLAVHTISTGTGMSLVVHSAEAEILQSVINALDKGEIPSNAVVVDMPILTDSGHIVFGGQTKIATLGRLTRTGMQEPYDMIVKNIKGAASRVRRQLAPYDGGRANIQGARRVIRTAISDVFDQLSGAARAGTREALSRDYRLTPTGTPKDLITAGQIDITELAEILTGEEFDQLGPEAKQRFIRFFKENARMYLQGDTIDALTFEGVREQKMMSGVLGTVTPRDLVPFGLLDHARRPNIHQWWNIHQYDIGAVERALAARGMASPIHTNPLVITTLDYQHYLATGEPGVVRGISIHALDLSSKDIVDILKGERAQQILRKHGLTLEEVMPTGTYEHGMVLAPELRGLLEARAAKEYHIRMDDLLSGRVRLGPEVSGWLSTAQPGDVLSLGRAYDSKLKRMRGTVMYEKLVDTAGGTSRWVATEFGDDIGELLGWYVHTKDGVPYLTLTAQAIYPAGEGTKYSLDIGKYTAGHFGPLSKAEAARAAWHEIFGEDVFALVMTEHPKYMEYGIGPWQTLKAGVIKYLDDPSKLEEFRKDIESAFGYGAIEILPGRHGPTIIFPRSTDLMNMEGVDPVYIQNRIKEIARKHGIDLRHVIDGIVTTKVPVELRRSDIIEAIHLTDWRGHGLAEGFGVKIGPRELKAITAKGLVLGVDVSPIIEYIQGTSNVRARAAYTAAAKSMVEATRWMYDPDSMSLPVYRPEQFDLIMDTLEGYYNRADLAQTIVGQRETVLMQLPEGFVYTYRAGRHTRQLTAIPVTVQPLIGTEVYLQPQARALRAVQETALDYQEVANRADISGLLRSGKLNLTLEEAHENLTRAIDNYFEQMQLDLSSSHGPVFEDAMSKRLPASGYVKAQNISANLDLDEAIRGYSEASRELLEEMLGPVDEGHHAWKKLLAGEDYYHIVLRHPIQGSMNIQVMKLRLNPELEGKVLRVSAIEASQMLLDYDGDRIGLLQAITDKMSHKKFDELQATLAMIHKQQYSYTSKLTELLHVKWREESERKMLDPTDFMTYLREKLEDLDDIGAAAKSLMWGAEHEAMVITSGLSKMASGPVYNVVHRYSAAALAAYSALGDVQRAGRGMELVELFASLTTEMFTLKGKKHGRPLEQVMAFMRDVKRGSHTLVRDWAEELASSMPDEMAIRWRRLDAFMYEHGLSTIEQLYHHKDLMHQVKRGMAIDMLDELAWVRATLDRAGFGEFFEDDSVPGMMFYSKQAAQKSNLVAMAEQYLTIDPDSPEFMRRFVPTTEMEQFAYVTGQMDQYLKARDIFVSRIRSGAMADFSSYGGILGGVEEIPDRVYRLNMVLEQLRDTPATQKLPEPPPLFGRLSRRGKIGLGLAAAALGTYLFVNAIRPPKELERPGADPDVTEFEREVPLELNRPDEDSKGRRIRVKAKSTKKIGADNIGSAIQQGFGSNVNVNLYQYDDMKTINDEWIQELFTQAVKYGNVSSSLARDDL